MGAERGRRLRRSTSSSGEDGDEVIILRRSIRSRMSVQKKHVEHDFISPWFIAITSMMLLSQSSFTEKYPVDSYKHMGKSLDRIEDLYSEAAAEAMYPQYKPRAPGLRWRDELAFYRPSWSNYTADGVQNAPIVMPVVTEHAPQPYPHMGRSSLPMVPTTSTEQAHTSRQDPTIEDIELIDVLWRSDIAAEKGTSQLAPSEQYERDLQMLTEKSIRAPLSEEESTRYEDLAKVYFEDFYHPRPHKTDKSIPQAASRFPAAANLKRDIATPTDEDLDALFEDVSKESGQLNQLADSVCLEGVREHPVLTDVSLSQGIIFNQNNVTELTYMKEEAERRGNSDVSQGVADLYNGSAIEVHPWITQAEVSPNDIFPNPNQLPYPAFPQNETGVEVRSDGVQYDHAYQTMTEPPAQTSHSHVYDPYYGARTVSFSNESSSGCSSSSATSPNYVSETENVTPPTSRYFGKLAPFSETSYEQRDSRSQMSSSQNSPSSGSSSYGGPPSSSVMMPPRRRGRQSKDEQLASSHNLPVTAQQISEMTLLDLQKLLKSDRLTDYQKTLIKKIRRRGKNKVAARTCRMRRGDRVVPKSSHWRSMTVPKPVQRYVLPEEYRN